MTLQERDTLVYECLRQLSRGNEPERAEVSRMLVDLGVVYNGSGPRGCTLVAPAPWAATR